MPKLDVMTELKRVNAVTLGSHFVYASDKHGPGYINMDPLYPSVSVMLQIGRDLFMPFAEDGVEVIAGPAVGGVALSVYTGIAAHTLDPDRFKDIKALWADKIEDEADKKRFEFERAGFAAAVRGKRVLVVEDLLTTGGSVAKVCAKVIAAGGELVGVSSICNRGGVTAQALGVVKLMQLESVNFSAEDPEVCSLCSALVPIVNNIGHGPDFEANHLDYLGGYVAMTF